MRYTSVSIIATGLSVLGTAGWPVAAVVLAVTLAAGAALRWVLSDAARTRRAVALIRALRRPSTP